MLLLLLLWKGVGQVCVRLNRWTREAASTQDCITLECEPGKYSPPTTINFTKDPEFNYFWLFQTYLENSTKGCVNENIPGRLRTLGEGWICLLSSFLHQAPKLGMEDMASMSPALGHGGRTNALSPSQPGQRDETSRSIGKAEEGEIECVS